MLALVITMLLKYVNYSTNPLWCIVSGPGNHIGLALAIFALLELGFRPSDLAGTPPVPPKQFEPISRAKQIVIAIGLGSLIHLVQTFLSDAGTLIAWSWSGFPTSGPTLHPFAVVVITFTAFGSFLRPFWCLAIGAAILHRFPDWLGFSGGLALVVYLSSSVPLYLRAATTLHNAFGYALGVNCILDVLAVVTTAYAFVPYGWLLRERTDLILLFTVCATEAGRRAIATIALPAAPPTTRIRNRLRDRLSLGAVVIVVVFAICSIKTIQPTPYNDHRLFTAGIWTVSEPPVLG